MSEPTILSFKPLRRSSCCFIIWLHPHSLFWFFMSKWSFPFKKTQIWIWKIPILSNEDFTRRVTRTKIRLSALVSPISVLIGEFCLFICLMKFDKRRGSYISITAKCFFSHLYHVADLKVVIIWTKEFCNFFSLFTFFSLPFTTWHFCKVIKWW